MTFVPAHEAHAIDKVSVSVTFSGPVMSEAWIPIFVRTAEVGREREFTIAEEGIAASLSVVGELGVLPTATTQLFSAGVGFKKAADNGVPLAEFMVQRNEIRIGSDAYVRWSGFRELVLDLLGTLLEAFPPDWPVAQIKLEYWDRFISPDGHAPWAEVVCADGRLPAWVAESQTNWHSHIGWFDDVEPQRRLVNVNVDALDEANERGEQVQTIRVYTATATTGPAVSAEAISKTIAAQIDDLHLLSKTAVKEVLSLSMTEQISLFPKGEI